jgi:hypothetical protein
LAAGRNNGFGSHKGEPPDATGHSAVAIGGAFLTLAFGLVVMLAARFSSTSAWPVGDDEPFQGRHKIRRQRWTLNLDVCTARPRRKLSRKPTGRVYDPNAQRISFSGDHFYAATSCALRDPRDLAGRNLGCSCSNERDEPYVLGLVHARSLAIRAPMPAARTVLFDDLPGGLPALRVSLHWGEALLMLKVFTLLAALALASSVAATSAPAAPSDCSTAGFHRSVNAAVDKAQEALDWYKAEAYRAAAVAASRAKTMAVAQRPCTAEDRRVKTYQINAYDALRKTFTAKAGGNLSAAAHYISRADYWWEKLTVIAAGW